MKSSKRPSNIPPGSKLSKLPRVFISRNRAPDEAADRSGEIAYGVSSAEHIVQAFERRPREDKSRSS